MSNNTLSGGTNIIRGICVIIGGGFLIHTRGDIAHDSVAGHIGLIILGLFLIAFGLLAIKLGLDRMRTPD